MKYIITLILSLLFITTAYSFAPQDSTAAGHNGQQVKEQVKAQENGYKSSGLMKQKRRGKDVFIDKDGDGICDQRVRGMGFKRGQKGHRQNGNGQSQGQGNGGNGSGQGNGSVGSGSGQGNGGNGNGNGNH